MRYDKEKKKVTNVWEGDIFEHKGTVSCYGSVEVTREHGMFHLFSPEGPWWQHKDHYGIYFKKPADSANDFYFTIDSVDMPAGHLPLKITDTRGLVQIDGRHVVIDVEYKDTGGHWKRPPINGRRKIDLIFPDDTRRFTTPLTKIVHCCLTNRRSLWNLKFRNLRAHWRGMKEFSRSPTTVFR